MKNKRFPLWEDIIECYLLSLQISEIFSKRNLIWKTLENSLLWEVKSYLYTFCFHSFHHLSLYKNLFLISLSLLLPLWEISQHKTKNIIVLFQQKYFISFKPHHQFLRNLRNKKKDCWIYNKIIGIKILKSKNIVWHSKRWIRDHTGKQFELSLAWSVPFQGWDACSPKNWSKTTTHNIVEKLNWIE